MTVELASPLRDYQVSEMDSKSTYILSTASFAVGDAGADNSTPAQKDEGASHPNSTDIASHDDAAASSQDDGSGTLPSSTVLQRRASRHVVGGLRTTLPGSDEAINNLKQNELPEQVDYALKAAVETKKGTAADVGILVNNFRETIRADRMACPTLRDVLEPHPVPPRGTRAWYNWQVAMLMESPSMR